MPQEGCNVEPVQAEEIRAALDRVLASPGLVSKRRGELLRYVVERTLAGEALSEYGIALDVFRKPETFDPGAKSTVRSEMTRMRKALAEYYAGTGADDSWRFEFPAGGYTPSFVRAQPPPPPAESASAPASELGVAANAIRWAIVAVLLAAGGIAWRTFVSGRPALRSVIVLPFANLTGDAANDYLADGLTESLTDSLAHVPSLRVVARTSAFQFRGKAADIREIGRRVDADTVVEGSLRKTEGRLQVTVQLNRTGDGYHILSRVFQGEPHDLLRVEDEMALPVLAALRPEFRPSGGRTPDPEARELILKARALAGYGAQDKFNRSIELIDQAIQKDPEYSGAWAALANTYAGAATNGFLEPLAAARQAKAAAAKALELDPVSADAYASDGYVDAMVLLDWKRGEQELRDALRLLPQSATVHQRLGLVLLAQGRFDPALAEARAAADLDPLVPATGVSVGMVYFMERRYDDALAQWRKLANLHPDAAALRPLIGMALEAKGDYRGAEAQFQSVAAQYPDTANFEMAYLLAASGRTREARRLLDRLAAAHPEAAFDFALDYGALGDRDRAFEWLERAWDHRICYLLKVHPFLDPLRKDPRYAVFLKRTGFER